jgi:hypothetical protein
MKPLPLLTLATLFIFSKGYGQIDSTQTNFLIGEWVLEHDDTEYKVDDLIFKMTDSSLQANPLPSITIRLLSSGECILNLPNPGNFCITDTAAKNHSWTYGPEGNNITIYHSEKTNAILSEAYPELNFPKRHYEILLQVVLDKQGNLGLEILDWP